MINWDKYKTEVIDLSNRGLSSREISEHLAKIHPEITPTHDRSIRQALQRWRDEDPTLEVRQKRAKVLVFDIETTPLVAYVWNNKPNYLPEGQIIQNWYVINWAAKWLFDDEVITGVLTTEEAKTGNDKRIVKKLWDLFNEADIIIAHYGDAFDIKMMNGRFLKYGMNLPMPYQSIDTKKAASKRLRLPANNLNYIARYLGLGQKHSTNFQLWVDCMNGDKDALNKMDKYCQQDVKILEDVYLHLRPFIQPHPNLGLFIETDTVSCPSCGSTNLKKEGVYTTTVNQYDAYRCGDCGSITRSRKSKISTEERKTITSSVPR